MNPLITQAALVAYAGFTRMSLDGAHSFYAGRLPDDGIFTEEQFDTLWEMHPVEFHEIMIHGRAVKTPRWQKAYGADYHYTGRVNEADPVPHILAPILQWCKEAIDPRLQGILLNWYDGSLGHYIGAHRDSTTNMVDDAPIITISLGEERTFRLRPWKSSGYQDFTASDGTVFITPYDTNLAWTHEVPHFRRNRGRRISITVRAFNQA